MSFREWKEKYLKIYLPEVSQSRCIECMNTQVYEFLKTVLKGKVLTYGQIAEFLGNKYLARFVE